MPVATVSGILQWVRVRVEVRVRVRVRVRDLGQVALEVLEAVHVEQAAAIGAAEREELQPVAQVGVAVRA